MSFVVVRMWDERAAIVPTSRFLENSFENWTRSTELLTGPVFLYLDPATDVAPIRAEFEDFVHHHPQWDKRTGRLLVTDARAGVVELRMAVSAATVGELFELRCALREHMLDWLRRKPYPVIDMRDAFRAAFRESKLGVSAFLKPYYNGHHSPAGNYFTARELKGRLVGLLDPKPLPYR